MSARVHFAAHLKWLFVAAVCFLGSFATAQAQTNSTWIGGAGNWEPCPQNGGNALWNTCPNYPNGNYNAIISGGPVTEQNDNNTVVNLTIGSGDLLNVTASYLYVNGTTISNNGTIAVSNGYGLRMGNLGGTTTLSGSGTLNLATSDLAGSGNPPVTFVNQQTIQGQGSFGVEGLTINNQATINATGGTLTVEPSSAGITNTGVMEASSGGTLDIVYGLISPLNNTGGTIKALDGGIVILGGPTVNGGTLTTVGSGIVEAGNSAVLNGVTNTGLLQVQSETTITLEKTISNTGKIELPGGNGKTIYISGAVTLTGKGTLTMADYPDDSISPLASGASLINSSTIEGGGQIDVKLTNHGTILANQTTPFYIAEIFGGELFTNAGKLIVNNGSTLSVSGPFKNLSAGTLTGGTYAVTGTLQLTGDITTNAANITLTGPSSQILDQSNGNALAGFAANAGTGTFTLAGGRTFTTAGAFANAGTMAISTGSTFTVPSGGFTQSGVKSKITVDGALAATGSGASIAINGGSVFGNLGTLTGNVSSSGTITPADSKSLTGSLIIMGTYTQSSAGALDINLKKATQFNQLSVSGKATIGGTLNIGRLGGFIPALGASFPILTCTTLNGTFATVNGTSINSTEHFVVQYNANNVTLEVVAGP